MYQVHIDYSDAASFESELGEIERRLAERPASGLLFHVFNCSNDVNHACPAVSAILVRFPQARVMGATANGNISDGAYVDEEGAVTVACTIFEDPTSTVEILQFPLDYETQDATAQALLDALAERPEVQAVEMLTTVGNVDMLKFCRDISQMPEDIVCFGGGAIDLDADFAHAAVFSSAGELVQNGVVFALFSGPNLHARVQAIHGWMPLGMPFHITRAQRSIIYELNGKPAYDMYNHYLHIANDESFSQNGLLFPLCFDRGGMHVLRTPMASNPDGSLQMGADISAETGQCRIAYGDPATILKRVGETAAEFHRFHPQAVMLYSCAARLQYWTPRFVNHETLPFQTTGPVAGFFTGSEFIRHKGMMIQHNVTMVVAGLREGEADELAEDEAVIPQMAKIESNRQLTIINHMASFIGAASQELQEAYDHMKRMARTDGLTGLANRREMERVISEALMTRPDGADVAPALIMFDLDDFKHVNDIYGHEAGDEVLRGVSDVARSVVADLMPDATVGRWGGEEFMVLLPCCVVEDALQVAEGIRAAFAAVKFPQVGFCTLSAGVALLRPDESFDGFCSRVDNALYAAKYQGKNRVMLDR